MSLDNFGRLNYYLNFEEGYFYYLQILRRKKDNPEAKHVKVIRNFYIGNKEYYNDIEQTVKDLCDFFNARAYLRLNVRSYEQVALKTLEQSAKYISDKQSKAVMRSYSKAAGRTNAQENRLWVIDIDDRSKLKDAERYIKKLQKNIQKDYKVFGTIPTPNGVHLITNPFNRNRFNEQFPEIDVHGDNPTVLYAP